MKFKEWLTEESDFVTSLGDELNIRPEDLKNIIIANFTLNDKSYNLASIDVELVKNGALIKINSDEHPHLAQKIVKKGKRTSHSDKDTYFIDKDTLTQMLMQGYEQAGQAPGVV